MIFVIADTHSNIDKFDAHETKIEKRIGRSLGADDIVICLGDLLGVSNRKASSLSGKLAMDRKFLNALAKKPYAIASVMGNHDDRRRIRRLKAKKAHKWGNNVLQVRSNVTYLLNGEVYEMPTNDGKDGETIRVISLGGAFGHLYRFKGATPIKRQSMTGQYSHLVHSLETIDVDYVLSHDVPTSRASAIVRKVFGITPINDCLDAIEDNLIFYDWYYGHHHFDFENAERFHGIYRRQCQLEAPSASRTKFNKR